MINAQAIGAIHTHVAVVTARYIILFPFYLLFLRLLRVLPSFLFALAWILSRVDLLILPLLNC